MNQVASRLMSETVIDQCRTDFRADRHGMFAAGTEAAAGGGIDRTRDLTRHENSLACCLNIGVW